VVSVCACERECVPLCFQAVEASIREQAGGKGKGKGESEGGEGVQRTKHAKRGGRGSALAPMGKDAALAEKLL
jgi:hypothetical protein